MELRSAPNSVFFDRSAVGFCILEEALIPVVFLRFNRTPESSSVLYEESESEAGEDVAGRFRAMEDLVVRFLKVMGAAVSAMAAVGVRWRGEEGEAV